MAIVLWPESEPVVDGQGVTKWALQYSQRALYRDEGSKSALAIQKAGQAAVKPLSQMLRSQEPPWVTKLILWSRKQRWWPLRVVTAAEKRTAALYGFSVLGSNVAPMLDTIVAYKPLTNSTEEQAFAALSGALARKEAEPRAPTFMELFSGRLARTEIFRIQSAGGVRYVAMGWWPGNNVPGGSFMSISLLKTNAQRLDWVEIGRSTRGGVLAFARSNPGAGYDLIITNGSYRGFAQPQIDIFTRTTNLFLMFRETNALLGIRIEGDRFHITAEHTSRNPFR